MRIQKGQRHRVRFSLIPGRVVRREVLRGDKQRSRGYNSETAFEHKRRHWQKREKKMSHLEIYLGK